VFAVAIQQEVQDGDIVDGPKSLEHSIGFTKVKATASTKEAAKEPDKTAEGGGA
jgi:hypothetical protein